MSFRLAVDLRPLLEPHESGVTVYTKGMLEALLKESDVELDLFYQARERCERIHTLFPSVRHLAYSNTVFHLKSFFTFPVLPKAYFLKKPDLIWIPDRRPFYRSNIPLVMTIHDKVPEKFPHTLSVKSRVWHRIFPLQRLLLLCSGLLAPSSTTAVELRTKLPIEVTYEGVAPAAPATPPAGAKTLLKRPLFLTISPADPRKRADWLLALAQAHPKLHFVWVGLKKGDKRFKKLTLKPKKNLFLYEAITEGEKTWFFQNSRALLALSAYEGFDLPVLEAVQAKCPVLLSDIAVHHELYKTRRPMIKEFKELHAALLRKGEIPTPRGRYTWEAAARRALLLFRRVVFHKDGEGSRYRNGNDCA